MSNDFYTYAYLREDRTPYYIGKGRGNRAYKRNKRDYKPPKDVAQILILKQNLTEDEAFKHEIYMIAVLGRKDIGTGILRNKTDGGEGSSGAIRSEAFRENMSGDNNPMRKIPKEQRLKRAKRGEFHPLFGLTGELSPNYGRICAEDTKQKISASLSGKNHPRYGITGEANPLFGVERPEHSERMMGEMNPMYGRTGELNPNYGKKWWVKEDGETYRGNEPPGPEWQRGRKWKFTNP